MVEIDTRFKPVEHITIASGGFSRFRAIMHEQEEFGVSELEHPAP